MKTFKDLMKSQWQDGVSLLLGVWLLISPWLLQFSGNAPAMWNSVILGVIIAVASASVLVRFHEWEEWVDMLMGVWLVISPWVLGYTMLATATWNHALVGLITIAMAAWSIWHFRHRQPTTA